MGITEISLFVLPLCLIWCQTTMRLLQLMLISAVFDASAVLILGGQGIQAGLMPAADIPRICDTSDALGCAIPRKSPIVADHRPFVLVALWAVLRCPSSCPRFWKGRSLYGRRKTSRRWQLPFSHRAR